MTRTVLNLGGGEKTSEISSSGSAWNAHYENTKRRNFRKHAKDFVIQGGRNAVLYTKKVVYFVLSFLPRRYSMQHVFMVYGV